MSIINLKSQTPLSGFYVVYKGSTNLEKSGIYGISHLMEHLVCKSLDPYQDELDRLGISYNAYTSGNEIVFFIKGLESSISKWRNKFVDLLTDFSVTKEEFENERNIVLQEYMDSFNDQFNNHWLNLDRKLFNNYNPIGSKSDLENLKWMDCLDFFKEQYMKPSMIINVSKDIEFGGDIDFNTPKNTKKYEMGEYPVEIERSTDYKGKVSLMLTSDIINEDFNKIKFVNHMFTRGLQSPFYQEIREKRGLVYYVGSHISRLNEQGVNVLYTMSSEENIDKITNIMKEILNNYDKFLTKERFNVTKESLSIELEKSEIRREDNVNRWIDPSGWSIYDTISDITYDEVMNICEKHFNFDNYRISRDDKEFS